MEAPVTKVDLRREQPALYRPTNRDRQPVDVPPPRLLAVDGAVDPNTSADYGEAVEALYSVAYTVKFASKTAPGRDHA